ncbi:hypothetical protein EDM76_11370 [bacterium]|nr:MAG: hypothetical protein EDM76_11370 [bacterium]
MNTTMGKSGASLLAVAEAAINAAWARACQSTERARTRRMRRFFEEQRQAKAKAKATRLPWEPKEPEDDPHN